MSKWLLLFFISFSVFSQPPKILFIGDSLTEGYGIEKQFAYPSIVQKLLGDKFRVINGGVSGSTTASGKSRLRWFFKSPPKIVVLVLGGNDILRGIQAKESYKNLKQIIEFCNQNNVKVILGGMRVPPNYGPKYTASFEAIYPRLQKEFKLDFIPNLLKGVGGVKELNQPDAIHPNKLGHAKIANTVYQKLKDIL